MAQVQFISTTPDQLQSEINAGVKIILEDFLKNFKPKQPNGIHPSNYILFSSIRLMIGA
jgi:hypothetical protein